MPVCMCFSVCLHMCMWGICTSLHMPQWPQTLPSSLWDSTPVPYTQDDMLTYLPASPPTPLAPPP